MRPFSVAHSLLLYATFVVQQYTMYMYRRYNAGKLSRARLYQNLILVVCCFMF